MNIKLKNLRKIVAIIVIALFTALFLDLNGILTGETIKVIIFFQFIPSLLKFLSAAGLPSAGFIIVVLLSIFAGRIYCSFLCPLGITIDLTSRIARKKKRKYCYSKSHNTIKYSILILSLVTYLSGRMVFINILDPYSNFGRLMTVIIKPVFVVINNLVSHIFEMMDIYTISPFTQPKFSSSVIIFTILFIFLIFVLAVTKGRLYCNTLCPVGTLLGLISKGAFFKLKISRKNCTSCGRCERICKASCINIKDKEIDFSRCINCYNCIDACPEESISYCRERGVNRTERPNHQRRAFMVIFTLVLASFSRAAFAITKPVVYVKNRIKVKRSVPLTPPGSVSVHNFTKKCTACYLCVSNCPGKVIQPHFSTFQEKGVLMPAMLNKYGYCNYNCTKCGEICPTGAILPVSKEKKKQIQIGKVVFIKKNCIVITQKTECGACSEHCPTKAVFMVVENNLRLPAVNTDICVGCGACEYACPAIPNKSIYVEGNPIHLKAEKPIIKKPKQPDSNMDFPF